MGSWDGLGYNWSESCVCVFGKKSNMFLTLFLKPVGVDLHHCWPLLAVFDFNGQDLKAQARGEECPVFGPQKCLSAFCR